MIFTYAISKLILKFTQDLPLNVDIGVTCLYITYKTYKL